MRQNLAAEMGIILPKVRVRDNMRLEQNQYRIKIADMAVAQGSIDAKPLDPGSAIAAHLSETVRRHADELLTRDAVKHLIDELRQTSPAVVDELIPGVMKLGEVQRVLQMLLREEVSIRQLGPILETLGDCATRAPRTRSLLAEHVRRRLARTICTPLPRQTTGCTSSRSTRRWRSGFRPARARRRRACDPALAAGGR